MSQYPQLDESFKALIAQGVPPEKIRADASAIGWQSQEIDDALATATQKAVFPQQLAASSQGVVESVAPEIVNKHRNGSPVLLVIVLLCMLVLVGSAGAVAYVAYTSGYQPFAPAPYASKTFASTLLSKLGNIKSGESVVKISAQIVSREANAQPINLVDPNATSTQLKYIRDGKRIRNVSNLLGALENFKYGGTITPIDPSNPADHLVPKPKDPNLHYPAVLHDFDPYDDSDPSGGLYAYSPTESGNNFVLKVTFETDAAIQAIQAVTFASTTTIVGKTVTFTKDSNPYLSFNEVPPKSLLESLSELTNYLSSDFGMSGSITAQKAKSSVQGTSSLPNTSVDINGEGDLGDLTYHVNLELESVDNQLYFKINHFPSLLSFLLPPKDQWIQLSATSTIGVLPTLDLTALETKYLKKNETLTAFHTKVAQVADSAGFFVFKNVPRLTLLDGKIRYEYDLDINKQNFTEFYKQIVEEAQKDPVLKEQYPFLNEDSVQFVQSPLFSQLFDYYVKNTSMKIWTKSNGDPVKLIYTMRVIPPDSNINMKDKELLITVESSFDNINGDVVIRKPDGAKSLKAAMEDTPLAKAATKAVVQLWTNDVRSEMEIFGSKPDGRIDYTGGCSNIAISSITDEIARKTSTPYCNSSSTEWVYQAPLNPGYLCVDSKGNSKSIPDGQQMTSGTSCN